METGLCNSKGHKKIHKRLIANINLGPCTETKRLHNSYIYNYMCMNTGNSKVTYQNKSQESGDSSSLKSSCLNEVKHAITTFHGCILTALKTEFNQWTTYIQLQLKVKGVYSVKNQVSSYSLDLHVVSLSI